MGMVTKPGFYAGKFRKAGQFDGSGEGSQTVTGDTPPDVAGSGDGGADLDAMTKDELIAEAERRGVTVKASDTKAEILAALKA
ncbi:hypothetical protein E3C22_18170 [Jiella endophytica]|uniref:Uncharacterized protein n=1 Tax=Jiella endophytica TaxID=2558362 RepID=A0A4Y8RFG1_9HYPH|nr:hypothetical protein [Jiella endophytica]TFF20814.1 hypothetical protein E3C22_18170 [Jiella endophytica]